MAQSLERRHSTSKMGTRGQPAASRAAILRAAEEEFTEHGIAGARTEAIAREARVNKALLYYYFKDKETLYGAVLDNAFSGLKSTVFQVLDSDLPPREKIMAYTGAYFRFIILLGIIFAIAATYYFLSTDHSRDLVLIGTVDANQVIVSAQVEGRIQKRLVDEGTPVKAGDLIAVLDPSELQTQEAAAAANIASLQHKVSETQSAEQSTSGSTSSDVVNAQAKLSSAKA